MMKKWIRNFLGISAIEDRLSAIEDEIFKLRNDLTVTYRDEYSKDRKALSDELANKAIEKMAADAKARSVYD